MNSQPQFTAQEWAAVTEAPLLAAARVVAAERGGKIGENLAVRRAYAAARQLRGESALLDALVADSPSIDVGRLLSDDAPATLAPVQRALAIVRARAAPHDVDAYKGFVLAVVQTAAEANREGGGVAGIGGEEVSPREQAALDELAAVVDRG